MCATSLLYVSIGNLCNLYSAILKLLFCHYLQYFLSWWYKSNFITPKFGQKNTSRRVYGQYIICMYLVRNILSLHILC